MAKIQPVKGTRDFYPDQMAVRNWIFDGWRRASIRSGFVEYDSPIFEYLQLYTQKSGEEIASQLFSLTDRGGRELAIRPETTPSLARLVNQKINALPRPIKWFSISRLCRAERPQKGRLREFFQWNIDIIGEDSVLADAECIYTAIDYLRSAGLTPDDIVVKISSRAMLAELLKSQGFAENRLEMVYSLLDKRPKLPEETFLALVEEQIEEESLRKSLLRIIRNVESLEQLSAIAPDSAQFQVDTLKNELFPCLESMGIGDYCSFDINIVRGLAYYTGMVFEIFDRQSQLRAICGGGRYDNLLAGLGGPQVPAVGFGMGDVVLEILLREKKRIGSVQNTVDFFIVDASPETFEKKIELAGRLRALGFSTVISYKSIALGKQLKQASQQNTRNTVILGQETLDNGEITLKNMQDGTQQRIALSDFLDNPRRFLPD